MIVKKTKKQQKQFINKHTNIQNGSGRLKDWFKRLFRRKPKTEAKLQPIATSEKPIQPTGLSESYVLDMGLGTRQFRAYKPNNKKIYKSSTNESGRRIFVQNEKKPELEATARKHAQPKPDKKLQFGKAKVKYFKHTNASLNNSPTNTEDLHNIKKKVTKRLKKLSNSDDRSIEKEPLQIYPSTTIMGKLRRLGRGIKNTIKRRFTRKAKPSDTKQNADKLQTNNFEQVTKLLNGLAISDSETYKYILESYYNYYIEFKLLKQNEDKTKLYNLITTNLKFNEEQHNFNKLDIFFRNINFKNLQNELYQVYLNKLEIIDVLIKDKIIKFLQPQHNYSVGGGKSVTLNDKDFEFIETKSNEIIGYLNNEQKFNGHNLLPCIQEQHDNIFNTMITYYQCIKVKSTKEEKKQCKRDNSFSDDYIQAYIKKLKKYIDNPEKAMQEYLEYQPLERTEEELQQIAGYMDLLGEPQFPSSRIEKPSENNPGFGLFN
jgi:uncharacterized protein YozE (UPF0346 family)